MDPRKILFAVLTGLALSVGLVFTGPSSAALPDGKATIKAKAHLGSDPSRIVAGGKAPKCSGGGFVVIRARVNQSGRIARGRWQGPCLGPRQTWDQLLKTNGSRFQPGKARAVVVARIKKKGKTVSRRTTVRRVTLAVAAGSPVGDEWTYGQIIFELGDDVHVLITGGGAITSNCTKYETVTDFTTETDAPRIVTVGFESNSSGWTCATEHSWSSFGIQAFGDQIGKGRPTLGQIEKGWPVMGYGMDCRSNYLATKYEWSKLKCERTGRYTVKVTWASDHG